MDLVETTTVEKKKGWFKSSKIKAMEENGKFNSGWRDLLVFTTGLLVCVNCIKKISKKHTKKAVQ